MLNVELFSYLDKASLKASQELAAMRGEPELLKGMGERMTCRMAIAPTTSSSSILGRVSPSIEPEHGMYYIDDLAKGMFEHRNPFVFELLRQRGKHTPAIERKILESGGSIQKLDCFSDHEKQVFKTFGEISQKEIVIQAAQRQKYIDQGQSLNLMIDPSVSVKEINALMIFAWQQGLKSLYYQRSSNPLQEANLKLNACVSCEG